MGKKSTTDVASIAPAMFFTDIDTDTFYFGDQRVPTHNYDFVEYGFHLHSSYKYDLSDIN